jgi:hypothetical protein
MISTIYWGGLARRGDLQNEVGINDIVEALKEDAEQTKAGEKA